MIRLLRQQNKFYEIICLFVLTITCFTLSAFRFLYTDTKVFLFLNWNLFLAFLPWLFSSVTVLKPVLLQKKLAIAVVVGSWLLFFPNAPYILTDLFHLRYRSSMPVWFDLVLILSFAWTGLLYGFLSLWNIEKALRFYIPGKLTIFISVALLFLGSFGIYLGRYLRWNSWDIIRKPNELLFDISDRFVNPFEHPRTWGMTILMGIFLNMVYWSVKMMRTHTH